MHTLFRAVVLLAVLAAYAPAQVAISQIFLSATSTGRSKAVVDVRNLGATNHLFTWTVTGTPSTCTLLLETSEDGTTWSTASTEDCSTNGSASLSSSSYQFLTANISVLSGGTSPTVSVRYDGYQPGQGLPVRPAEGGTGTTTPFTAGSLVFAGASGVYAQDNSNFYVDDSNNRFCVGTTGSSNCTATFSVGASKFLVTSAGLATAKGGGVVNSDGGGLTRAFRVEVTDAATTIGSQVEGYASQSADLEQWLRDGGTVRARIAKDGAFASAMDTATTGTTTTIDGNKSNNHKITLDQNTTLAVTTTGMTAGQVLRLLICQDGTGSWTFAWPASFKYSFTVTSTASKCDSAQWIWDGTDFYGLGTAVQNQ